MRKEAKIGLAVVVVLGGVFAFIVYKGMKPRDGIASKRPAKETEKRKGSSSGQKPAGGLLDRWDGESAAKAGASHDDDHGTALQSAAPATATAGQGAGGNAGDAQDPFAGRSAALDRYAGRYDQNATQDRSRISIYGDDEDQAGAGDEHGAAPGPLPDTGGESVRRVSVYGPAPPGDYRGSASADDGNPLRGDAKSGAQDGSAGGQAEADPPGRSYNFRSDTDDPRDTYGRGTAAAQDDTYDGSWRRQGANGAASASNGYDSTGQRSNTYGSNSYGKTGYEGSSYGSGEGRSQYGSSQQGASQYGSSQYGSSQQGSPDYGKAGDAAYGSAGYGRSSSSQAVAPVAPRRDGKYVVQPNDSCWLISRKLFGTGAYFKAIEEHNRHNYPRMDQLQVGDVLEVPTAEQLRAAYPDLCPKVRNPAPQGPRGYQVSATRRRSSGGRVYVVQDGDNLFDIARYELGSAKRWVEIFDLNRELLSDDYDYLPVGAELILPDDDGSADAVTERPRSPYSR